MTPPTSPVSQVPRTRATSPATRPMRSLGSVPRPTSSGPFQVLLAALALCVAVIAQNVVFSHLAWHGVTPDLVLLVVVAIGLTRGAQSGLVTGFAGGLLLDLVPPADHVAGRWALALMVVGYVAGRLRQEAVPGAGAVVATVAACSFLATSIFALSGLVLQTTSASIPDLLGVVLAGVVWDVGLTLLVLAVVLPLARALRRRARLRASV